MNEISIDERQRFLATQWPLRPGGENFDVQYALNIAEASDRVALQKLVDENPGKSVVLPMGNMGYIPHEKT